MGVLTPDLSDAEIAWAAGLFEGEGCFTRTVRRQVILRTIGGLEVEYMQLQMSLSMTDEDVVRRYHSIVNCGGITIRDFPGKLKRQWMWQVQRLDDVKRLYDTFYPWLGERRRHRGQEVIDEYQAVREYREEEIANANREYRNLCAQIAGTLD